MTSTTAPPLAQATSQSAPATASTAPDSGRLRNWVLGFGLWTLLALLVACQHILYLKSVGRPIAWGDIILGRLADWYTCAAFTPGYFWIVRRWPLDRRHVFKPLAVYVAATAVFVVGKFALYAPLANALRDDDDRVVTLRSSLAGGFITENVAFWCVLGIVLAVEYYRRIREQELRAAQLVAELSDARLDALAAQLHPHFLFNTLQGISTLIHRDPPAADAMLARLSELLRRTLRRGGGHEIPLAQELELLRLYIGIVESRFADRLVVTFDVAPGLDDALVPHFILQPLVENALHHGIARRAGAGRVEIAASRAGDELVLAVTDDGPAQGASTPAPLTEGIGLSNTRRRLAQLYGADQRLEIEALDGGGFRVAVRLPWHLRPVTEAVAP